MDNPDSQVRQHVPEVPALREMGTLVGSYASYVSALEAASCNIERGSSRESSYPDVLQQTRYMSGSKMPAAEQCTITQQEGGGCSLLMDLNRKP